MFPRLQQQRVKWNPVFDFTRLEFEFPVATQAGVTRQIIAGSNVSACQLGQEVDKVFAGSISSKLASPLCPIEASGACNTASS